MRRTYLWAKTSNTDSELLPINIYSVSLKRSPPEFLSGINAGLCVARGEKEGGMAFPNTTVLCIDVQRILFVSPMFYHALPS